MAMTKKERAELDALKQENALMRVLLAGEIEAPGRDLPVPPWGSKTSGWDYNAYRLRYGHLSGCVFQAWSEYILHGEGPERRGSGSQGGRALFSTRLLALKALRAEHARDCGAVLATIDAEIEKEERA